MKASFDEDDHWWLGAGSRVRSVATVVNASLASIGLVAKRAVFTNLPVGEAASYHVEFTAPEETFLSQSRIRPQTRAGRGLRDSSRRSARVHFHVPSARRSDEAQLRANVHARRAGAYGAVAITALGTAAVLLAAADRAAELDEQTSAALLVLVPTVLLAYLTRPGEHIYATRLLLGVRLLGGLAAACSLWFAMLLATGALETDGGTPPALDDPAAVRTAEWLALVSSVVALVLAAGFAAPALARIRSVGWGVWAGVAAVLGQAIWPPGAT